MKKNQKTKNLNRRITAGRSREFINMLYGRYQMQWLADHCNSMEDAEKAIQTAQEDPKWTCLKEFESIAMSSPFLVDEYLHTTAEHRFYEQYILSPKTGLVARAGRIADAFSKRTLEWSADDYRAEAATFYGMKVLGFESLYYFSEAKDSLFSKITDRQAKKLLAMDDNAVIMFAIQLVCANNITEEVFIRALKQTVKDKAVSY